jgi:hypothetical protein
MAGVSPNPITNLNQDWGNDIQVGMPFSGEAIQSFIKAYLAHVTAAAWFNPTNNTMFFFASEEDKAAYISDQSQVGLISFACAMEFSGTLYRVNITNNNGSTNLHASTNDGSLVLSNDFTVQTKAISDPDWTDTQVGAYVTISIDRGVTGTFVPLTERTLYPAGSTINYDVFGDLVLGTSRVKITYEAEDGTVTQSLIYTISLAELYVELFENTWYLPVKQSDQNSWYLGGFRIAGAGYKVLNFEVYNTAGTKVDEFTQNIGTTNAYATTPYFYRFGAASPFLALPTGAYRIVVKVSTDTLESEPIEYSVMYVRTADEATAQIVVANELPDRIYNYSSSTLAKFAAYDCGGLTTDVQVTFYRMNGAVVVDSTTRTLENRETSVKQDLQYSAEWEVMGDGYSIAFELTLGQSTARGDVPLDNSTVFPPTPGFDFYLSAAAHANSDSNRDKIVNEVNGTEIAATWGNVDFIDGVDGWTEDEDGHRCLLIPAGCSLSIPYSGFKFFDRDNMTIEMAYRVKNVSEIDENVITIATNPTQDGFQGLRVKTNTVTLHSASDTSAVNDPARGTKVQDEELVHLLITINPNFEGTHKLVRGYVNGCKAFEFTYSASTDWPIDANLIVAPQKSDVYLYFVRHYATALGDQMAQNNYINSLYEASERIAMDAFIRSVVDAGQTNVDFEMVKNNDFNFFVITMENGASIPSAANGWGKSTKGLSTLEVHYGKHPEWDWKAGPMETAGQGTTSMDYYRWNIRWRIDKTNDSKKVPVQYLTARTKVGQSYQYAWGPASDQKTLFFDGANNHPALKRITGKINMASSMQSHKMGATKAYSDLLYALGLLNNAQAAAVAGGTPVPVTAVYQYPFFGFEYDPMNMTYTFCGLFTMGPDKGDKPSFGFDTTESSLISMEGTDHSQPLAKFAYPWNNDVQFLASEEGLTIVKGTGSYETGLEVGNCHGYSTDKASDQETIAMILQQEFKPAYDLVWNNSTLIFGIALGTYAATAADTLAYINSHLQDFRQTRYDDRFSYADMQFWIDGEYVLYFYDVKLGQYVAGQSLGAPSGSTIAEKNDYFKAQRRAAFKASAENYWDIQDALFHFDFLIITGATDNFAKNTYPYKMGLLASGGRWKWRQDDLDSILDIDNSGADTKPYYIEYTDAVGGSPYFAGSASIFWNLIFECYWDDYNSTVSGNVSRGLLSMGKAILEKMRDLSNASSTYEGFIKYIGMLFWDKAQRYFPQSAYNVDANFKYEQAWLNNGQNVDPLSQALGNHISAEMLWVHRRAVYMLSLFHAGPFGDYSDTSLGTISFRPLGIDTELVPAMWLYPAIGVGQNTMLGGGRTQPGQPCHLATTGDGNTSFYIQGSNFLSSLGDLKALRLGSQYVNPLTITGAKLVTFKIGDAVAGNVNTNVPGLEFANTKCLETIDARNADSIRGAIDLTVCRRLRSLKLSGTSITDVTIQKGSKVTEMSLPALQSLRMRFLKHLTNANFSMDSLAAVATLVMENNAMDSLQMLTDVYGASQVLEFIRVIWDNIVTDTDGSKYNMLVAIANGNYHGLSPDGQVVQDPVIEGALNVLVGIYQQDVDELNEKFPNLVITGSTIYIRFVDARVQSKCATAYGDGTGTTKAAAEAVASMGTTFKNDTQITSFNELEYFKNAFGANSAAEAFRGCSALASVRLPEGATHIMSGAFYGCSNLESIHLPASITTIQRIAFQGCSKLAGEINLPNLTSLSGDQAFVGTKITAVRSLGSITTLGQQTFQNCTALTSVVLPNTVTTITQRSFFNCSALETVEFPQSIESVEYQAFYGTKLGGSINLPNLMTLGSGAFGGTKVTAVTSLGNILSIAGSVFQDCKDLVSVTIPGNVTSIDANAFYGCVALATINLPQTITSIGSNAFLNAKIPIVINLPNLENLGSAFNGSGITAVTSLGRITTIGQSTFNYCKSLTSVVLPNTLTTIDDYAFYQCTALTSISLPTSITTIGGAAFSAVKAQMDINLPNLNTLRTSNYGGPFIGSYVETVTSLGVITNLVGSTFQGCSRLTTVVLPSTLTTIGGSAFYGCTALVYIKCLATTPPTLTSGALSNTNNTFKIYVPYGCGNAYKTTTNWSAFASRIYELDQNGNIPE